MPVVLVLVQLTLLVAGCAAEDPVPVEGGCVTPSSDAGAPGPLTAIDCADPAAQHTVLRVSDDGNCDDVDGVTATTYVSPPGSLCLGPVGPPVRTPNLAVPGDCLSDTAGSDVRRVPCTDPAAVFRVLERTEEPDPFGDFCGGVRGSTASYVWKITSDAVPSSLIPGITLCLIEADRDPLASPDLAQVGDCLNEAADEDRARVDCSAPEAEYRVLYREDTVLLDITSVCSGVPGVTSGVSRETGLADGYTLCLGPA